MNSQVHTFFLITKDAVKVETLEKFLKEKAFHTQNLSKENDSTRMRFEMLRKDPHVEEVKQFIDTLFTKNT